jgi:hypothetical protein
MDEATANPKSVVRAFRGELTQFPADCYVASSSGALSGGVALSLAEALRLTTEIQAHPRIPLGHAASFSKTPGDRVAQLVLANTGTPAAQADHIHVTTAIGDALQLVPRPAGDRWPVVGMPMLGTRLGLADVGPFLRSLRAALLEAEELGHGPFEICVAVPDELRQRALLRRLPPPRLPPVAERLAGKLLGGGGLLFVGPGLSQNAQPPLPTLAELLPDDLLPAPSAKPTTDLEQALAQQLEALRLPDRAQAWADRDGAAAVHAAVLQKVAEGEPRPSLKHFQLLALPWDVVVTTNYDTLIEDTLHAQGRPFTVVRTDEELVASRGRGGLRVVKIFGGLLPSELGPDAPDGGGLVFTRDEHEAFFQKRPGIAAFLESQLLTSYGLVVGHSMTDPQFRALFSRIGHIRALPSPGESSGPVRKRAMQGVGCVTTTTAAAATATATATGTAPEEAFGILALDVAPIEEVSDRCWRPRNVRWHSIGSYAGLREFVDRFASFLTLQHGHLPTAYPSGDLWRALLGPLGTAKDEVARVVAALLREGAHRPTDAVLTELADIELLFVLAGEHFTPEDKERLRSTPPPAKRPNPTGDFELRGGWGMRPL